MSDRIEATYRLETADDPARAAAVIAGEQSSGTFVAWRTRRGSQRKPRPDRGAGRGGRSSGAEPAGAMKGPNHRRCLLRLSCPVQPGPSLPKPRGDGGGQLYELKSVSGLRLVDLKLPPSFADRYAGRGTASRHAAPRRDRRGPLIGTIVKRASACPRKRPSRWAALLAGGDRLRQGRRTAGRRPPLPLRGPVRAVMRVVRAAAERTGRTAMIAFNLTGDLDEMRRRHDLVLAEGARRSWRACTRSASSACWRSRAIARCRSTPPQRMGLPVAAPRARLRLRPLADAVAARRGRSPSRQRAGQQVLRAGRERGRSAQAVLAPLFPNKPMAAMPVFSSGQTARQAAPTYAAVGTTDLIFAAGGGIFGHPAGFGPAWRRCGARGRPRWRA
jgi:ribulose-bisphosphate carboxylase large chain